jgi:HEAT repeat protein
MGVRLGLLAELDRRGALEDAPARWVALLEGARGAERVAVIRALGAHPSPPVTAALVGELEGEDAAAAEAAAVALGVPGLAAAAAPLAAALADGPPRLRMAAIRGLGRVGTAGAREALADAAAGHPDPATRRRAEAELRRLAGPAAGGVRGDDPAARTEPAPTPDPQPAPSAPVSPRAPRATPP